MECSLWLELGVLLLLLGEFMSKRVLLFCASLAGACLADGAADTSSDSSTVVASQDGSVAVVDASSEGSPIAQADASASELVSSDASTSASAQSDAVVSSEASVVSSPAQSDAVARADVSANQAAQSDVVVNADEPVSQVAQNDAAPEGSVAQPVQTQVEVTVPPVHELPGIRIDQGPVVIEPSYGCSEENVEALAHATVQALHATLNDVAATVEQTPEGKEEVQKIETAQQEIQEAVSAVENAVSEVAEAVEAVGEAITGGQGIVSGYIPAIIDFISSYYNAFVEFFKQGWKYMVYNSVNRATRHIVLSSGHRSPVDLSALAQVNDFAVDCFSKMNEAKNAILSAAEQRSPQLRQATELYLTQYESWFKGTADAFVDLNATRAMLACLGVENVDSSAFAMRNMDHFASRGGKIRHENLFLIVSPGEISKYEGTPLTSNTEVADEPIF